MSSLADHDDIERLAYTLWLERGSPHGSSELDWLRAERLLAFSRPDAPAEFSTPDFAVETASVSNDPPPVTVAMTPIGERRRSRTPRTTPQSRKAGLDGATKPLNNAT